MKGFAIALLALTAGAWANDGYSVETGAAINFSKSKSIQMVSENIDIRLGDETSRVHVDFVFKNHGGKQTVTMAFPDQGYNSNVPNIKDFKSWVDGAPTKVAFKNLTVKEDEEYEQKGVWTKRVLFGAGQTRKVRVTYTAPNGGSTLKDADCDYILTTGATWFGKIQEARVTVDWSTVKKLQAPIIWEVRKRGSDWLSSPVNSNWRVQGKSATGVYKNFIPDFDLSFDMMPGFWNFFINGEPVRFAGNPKYPMGDPRDILFPVDLLGDFFTVRTPTNEYQEEWTHPCTKIFGGKLEFPNKTTMLIGNGKRATLKRPIVSKWRVNVWNKDEGVEMVRLKDVIEGVGGSYRYVPSTGRVEIRIPK